MSSKKRPPVEDSDDEQNNEPVQKKTKKSTRKTTDSGGNIAAVVALFFKSQLNKQVASSSGLEGRTANCLHCDEEIVAWTTTNGKKVNGEPRTASFRQDRVKTHLEVCKYADGSAANKRCEDFVADGSRDLNILFPDNENNKHYYRVECELCQQLVHASVEKPKGTGVESKAWSTHLQRHCPFVANRRLSYPTENPANHILDSQFTDAEIYHHTLSTGVKQPCFYRWCSKVALIHDEPSFRGSTTYSGYTDVSAEDPFAHRHIRHIGGGKLNLKTTDSIPIAFSTSEGVKLLEAVDYQVHCGLTGYLNSSPPIQPLIGISPREFDVAYSSLIVLTSRCYEYFRSNLAEDYHTEQVRLARQNIVEKARTGFVNTLVDESARQLADSVFQLLTPGSLTVLLSNPEFLQQFNELSAKIQKKVGGEHE